MKNYILAHAADISHEEPEAASDVAAIDPVYIGGAVLAAVIIGFIVWKFLMKK